MKGKDVALFFGFVVAPMGFFLGAVYYGPKIKRWYLGETPDKQIESIVNAVREGIKKRKKSDAIYPDNEAEVWIPELKKLSPEALTAFKDWIVLTFPFGKDKSGSWSYETQSPEKGIEFNAKKDALYPKFADELINKTKVQMNFDNLEKTLQ